MDTLPRPVAYYCLEPLEDRTMLSLIGQSLFPADNPWNQRIDQAPIAANSATIMNAIVGKYGDGRLHPDFGQDYRNSSDLYGIPYNVVHGNSVAKIHVVIDAYPDESDIKDAPIPTGAVIEGDLQNGPKNGVDARGDSHLIIWDEDNNVAYEFYRASRPSENSDRVWHADGETVWDMKTNTFRTLGWTSADAAGLAILPGLVRPDEGLPTSQGGQGAINHAIRFTLQNAVILNQFLYPASHVANAGNNNPATEPPMGARFRLKASVDISGLNPQSRIIAQAMKDYGIIVADNGSNFYFSGASYAVDASNNNVLTWNDNDIQDSVHGLKSLHFSNFEVVDLTPVVTGLSASSGSTGTQITVTGKNFSGAAGHLKVLFGNTAATSVHVLDDSHVQAIAPAGTGTVDVRVQSGVSDPNDSQNIKSPVFGYGTSAVSAADRFTYAATSLPGDANRDGACNFADYLVLEAHFGSAGTWSQGDFNADNKVDFADYLIMEGNFGTGALASQPPLEPAAMQPADSVTTASLAGQGQVGVFNSTSNLALPRLALQQELTTVRPRQDLFQHADNNHRPTPKTWSRSHGLPPTDLERWEKMWHGIKTLAEVM